MWIVDLVFGIILLMYCILSFDYGVVFFGMVELLFDDDLVICFEMGEVVV